jgi:hypothetical protein
MFGLDLVLLGKIFAVVSAVVTFATAIVASFPNPKAEGILATVRSILSFLSGNVGFNK